MRTVLFVLLLPTLLGVVVGCEDSVAPSVTLTGRVLRYDGTPVPGARIAINGCETRTSGTGAFTVDAVPPGALVATVRVDGERPHPVPVFVDALPTPTPIIVPIPAVAPAGTVDLWFGGDVMFARRFQDANGDGDLDDGLVLPGAEEAGVTEAFRHIAPFVQDADLSALNLETAVTDQGLIHPRKPYTLRSAPAIVQPLAHTGIGVVGLGNNHVYDYTEDGIGRMLDLLDDAGLPRVGAGRSWDEAVTPLVLERNGVRIAIISATSITGRKVENDGDGDAAEPEDMPPYYTADPPEETGGVRKAGALRLNSDNLDAAVARANAAGADLIVLVAHGGTQYSDTESEFVRAMAHHAIEQGVDLVVAHHPHVIQGVETYLGVPIIYSLGNLIFDQEFPETFPALVVEARGVKGRGFETVALRPIWLHDYVPRVLAGPAALAILRDVAARAARLGASLTLDETAFRAVIGVAPEGTRHDVAISAPLHGGRSAPVALDAARTGAWFPVGVAAGAGTRVDLGRDVLVSRGFRDGGADDVDMPPGWEIVGREKRLAGGILRLERTRASEVNSTARTIGRRRLAAGTRLTLTGRWRADADAGTAEGRVLLYAGRDAGATPAAIVRTRAHLTTAWTQFYVDVVVPTTARYVQVELAHVPPTWGARGDVEFEDVALVAWTGAGDTGGVAASDATWVALEGTGANGTATVTLARAPLPVVMP